MTEALAIEALQEIQQRMKGDAEVWHIDADRVLCELLEDLGYKKVVDEWHKISKWYA
jgi:hypothetical protein